MLICQFVSQKNSYHNKIFLKTNQYYDTEGILNDSFIFKDVHMSCYCVKLNTTLPHEHNDRGFRSIFQIVYIIFYLHDLSRLKLPNDEKVWYLKLFDKDLSIYK